MDFMVRHMHKNGGVDLPTAVRMATLTPARILGLAEAVGSLAVGKRGGRGAAGPRAGGAVRVRRGG